MSLTFTHDEISNRYEQFVKNFMSSEKDVERIKLLPHFWIVTVPSKDFKVSITCECIGHFHGIEEWCAVVEEPNGEKSNYLLFEEEIEQWSSEQRKLRGIE
jgi:hypothetical protein